ncbi:phosphoesterase RecJ domain-containing protein [Desulfofundulus australicus DSM 11792]|uniref:Phosphoesterase RecJ domain-containing protein n=1 Tax=Desulfofundulus australicus DSM 11792 TaxID=1121425 RepID=A0A1M4UP60_9FIRM|nr:bifunctional oligoribonuclease/PAP phosphatase NrnA [Desulfofundulus australicus]SHE58541.1 phosphoesterase RecJ domain-containing protein [Desulfofundulus australicus DSM 11792]
MTGLDKIAECLQKARQVILSGHVMPDGDCLGSVAALGLGLMELGKQVTLASPDPLPELYQFLPGADRFLIGEEALKGTYDTFVVLDSSVPDRLGPLKELLVRDLVVCVIDHHVGNHDFGHFIYVDPKAAATGEIIQDLLDLLHVSSRVDIASCLYTAIVTDTGSFRYQNTTPLTHRRVARLMEEGVDAARLSVLLFEQKSLLHLRVLQAALQTLDFTSCGRVGWMSVTRETLDSLGAREEHTDGLIDYVRSLRGVEVALLFREIESGCWKVGFRSRGQVDVQQVASRFNGGGHLRAAGAVVRGEGEAVIKMVVRAVLEVMQGD